MRLIFIHGAPAVGKLTVARELANITGFRLFHNHLTVDLLTAVFDFDAESFIALRESIWLSVFREAAQREISLIFTFNPESTVRERFIHDTIDAVESRGGRVIFIELTCSVDEMERRIENPSRRGFGKLHSLEQYRELKRAGAFEHPIMPDVGRSYDTTSRNPKEVAQMINEYIRML